MLECDDTQLWRRIETADAVMRARLKQLSEVSSLGSEQVEIESALDYLSLLKDTLPRDPSKGPADLFT
jgi:hypothetical protein